MHDSNGAPSEPPTEPDTGPPRRGRRRGLLVALAAVVAVVAGAAGFMATREDEPPPTTTTKITSTTTSTSTTTTTTAPAEVLPVGTYEVATAKPSVPALHVRAEAPPQWRTTPRSLVYEPAQLPPSSQGAAPERPALPRPDLPVVGRFAVDGGWEFHNPGPYEPAQPFTMLVTERRGEWVEVMVPVRPNGTRGWVPASEVDLSRIRHRVEVRLAERVLRAWDGDDLVAETAVVVGSPATRTPTGVFYLTDLVPQRNPGGPYGPIALATDGYSESMDQFDTGVPVIALHGTNRPDLLGQAVSNGCIRMPNDVVTLLAERLPLGTPVHIWP